MAGKLTFTLQEYQEAATKWRSDLLMLPIIGIQDTLKYMTSRPGIRYKEQVGALSGDAQFGPYKPSRSTDFNLNIDYRTLETFLGSVVAKFEPNSAVSTLLGQIGDTKGDGQMKAPTAMHVLALIAKSLSEHLNEAIWAGRRNPNGDTSLDLFDGFDTITEKEIASGAIAAENKNYMKLTDTITNDNAVDIAKEILFSLDPRLRAQDLYMFCTQEFADAYNESYLLTHGGINYNTKYGQDTVEGSNGRLHIIPMFNKIGSKFIHICPKVNMLVGYDQMGDVESVMVKEYEPFILSYIATMFFGVQFESLDMRRFKVIELADNTPSGNNSGNTIVVPGNGNNNPTVESPVISGNTPFNESTQVTISGPAGASIYYTSDGGNPSTASNLYSGAITLSESATIKAIAVKDGVASAVATKVFNKAEGDGSGFDDGN